ncbi:MAG: slipin family protein [Candidatus Diapherotrites archaeon]|jgi:regulator of protease activity HflC (stomatin/prohibitin superfamily)|nr:slipin family protein [Candidatus Diapherotrites archaeon]MBT4596741.1 slipin family protein [Candidatus Diapherotrites archaeon]
MTLWSKILIVWAILVIITAFLSPGLAVILVILLFFTSIASIKIIFEYQSGVVFTLGRYSGKLEPGLKFVIPAIQKVRKVDLRINVTDVPEQSPITKDNVSIRVDAVIYFKIRGSEAENSIIKVENYKYAINQLAQTTMRNIIGEMTLDEILSKRDNASRKIKTIVDKASDPWGITVEAVELKHVELPETMKLIMAKAAEAERIKRAAIIKASGEALASKVVSKAAGIIGSVNGGLNLRTLQELDNIASDQSNEVTFFVPLDLIKSLEGYKKKRARK